jgi:hypothetical protein
LVRVLAFFPFASAYLALLPLVARHLISDGPQLYGILLAAIGVGTVGGSLIIRWLKDELRPDRLVAAGSLPSAIGSPLMPSTCTKGYCWPGFPVSAPQPRSSAPRAGELDAFLESLPEVADRSYRGADSSCRGLHAPSVAGHIAGSFRRGRVRWGPAHMRGQRPMQDWVPVQTTQSKPSQTMSAASGLDQLENLTSTGGFFWQARDQRLPATNYRSGRTFAIPWRFGKAGVLPNPACHAVSTKVPLIVRLS